ncbi:MAG: DUF4150 domain-containing protein [Pseudomonadota bacterium]
MSLTPDGYVGEPDYPDPWTTSRPLEGLRDNATARIVSLSPDVCLTPVGSSVVPIPYPVVDNCGDDENYTPSVRFTRQRAMVMRSNTTCVHGDAPGTRKGVKSGTVGDICEPIGHAAKVRAERSHVIRHLDRFHMNKRNTVGEAIFVRDMARYEAPLDTDPVPGSLFFVEGETYQVAQAFTGTMTDASPSFGPGTSGLQSAGTAEGTQSGTRPSSGTTTPRTGTGTGNGSGLGRRGLLGIILGELARDLSMTPDDRAADARAIGIYNSRAGRVVIRRERLLGGRQPVTNPLDIFSGESWEGKYGIGISGDERVPLANDIMSTLAGRPVDIRTLSDAEMAEILAPFQGLSEAEIEERLAEMEAEAEAAPDPEEDPEPRLPVPFPPGVRIDEDEDPDDCLVGEYSVIYDACTGRGGRTHHIVPDMTYRLVPRRGHSPRTTDDRIPNAPTLNQGMSICLTPAQHSSGPTGIHGRLNGQLDRLGATSPVPGTASMGRILRQSNISVAQTPGLTPECIQLANRMATEQVVSHTGLTAPGRTQRRLPLSDDAIVVLERGHY